MPVVSLPLHALAGLVAYSRVHTVLVPPIQEADADHQSVARIGRPFAFGQASKTATPRAVDPGSKRYPFGGTSNPKNMMR
jgi:hypothetical protein